MELITNSDSLNQKFVELLKEYDCFECAVAWAGDVKDPQFATMKALCKQEDKIIAMVVGLHFYQTSPNFIERFLDNENVKYIYQTDGTFHPKVFLFYNNKNDWKAIIGSANLTSSAFSANEEVCILVSDEDNDNMFPQIHKYITTLWKKSAENMTEKDLNRYKEIHDYQNAKRKGMKRTFKTASDEPQLLDVMDWETYAKKVGLDRLIQYRIEMLNQAQDLFKRNPSFDDIDRVHRQMLAGCISGDNSNQLDWKMFGSTNGNGLFHHNIIACEGIGKELDRIPLEGDVTKAQFNKYLSAFLQWKEPIATVTRLLAIKRPDFFVCINNENKKLLSKALNIPPNHFTIQNYWDILMRLQRSEWYTDTSRPISKKERAIKQYRMALIDSLCYEKDDI